MSAIVKLLNFGHPYPYSSSFPSVPKSSQKFLIKLYISSIVASLLYVFINAIIAVIPAFEYCAPDHLEIFGLFPNISSTSVLGAEKSM